MNKEPLKEIKQKLEALPDNAKMYFLGFAEGCAMMKSNGEENEDKEKGEKNHDN